MTRMNRDKNECSTHEIVVDTIRHHLDAKVETGFLPTLLRREAVWSRFLKLTPQAYPVRDKAYENSKWKEFVRAEVEEMKDHLFEFCLESNLVVEPMRAVFWEIPGQKAHQRLPKEYESVQVFAQHLARAFFEEEYPKELGDEFYLWIQKLEAHVESRIQADKKEKEDAIEKEKSAKQSFVAPTLPETNADVECSVEGETLNVYLVNGGITVNVSGIDQIEKSIDKFNLVYREEETTSDFDPLDYFDPDEVGTDIFYGKAVGYRAYELAFFKRKKPKLCVSATQGAGNTNVREPSGVEDEDDLRLKTQPGRDNPDYPEWLKPQKEPEKKLSSKVEKLANAGFDPFEERFSTLGVKSPNFWSLYNQGG